MSWIFFVEAAQGTDPSVIKQLLVIDYTLETQQQLAYWNCESCFFWLKLGRFSSSFLWVLQVGRFLILHRWKPYLQTDSYRLCQLLETLSLWRSPKLLDGVLALHCMMIHHHKIISYHLYCLFSIWIYSHTLQPLFPHSKRSPPRSVLVQGLTSESRLPQLSGQLRALLTALVGHLPQAGFFGVHYWLIHMLNDPQYKYPYMTWRVRLRRVKLNTAKHTRCPSAVQRCVLCSVVEVWGYVVDTLLCFYVLTFWKLFF